MPMVIIHNREARIHQIGIPTGAPGMNRIITLLPGNNPVDEDDWKKCMEIDLIAHHYVPKKVFEHKGFADSPQSVLENMTDTDAFLMISETLDLALLNSWLPRVTTRPAVSDAVSAQISRINAAAGEKGKELGGRTAASASGTVEKNPLLKTK
jgi:hypothetical protein